MRTRFLTIVAAVVPAVTFAVASGPAATAAPDGHAASAASAPVRVRQACGGTPTVGTVRCLALLRVSASGKALASPGVAAGTLPLGYGPRQLQSAYQLVKAAAAKGGNQTVAVVDAYDDPNAEADLNTYRAEYGLPPCTTANGCFQKVNQDGAASPLPAPDANWAVEESLDMEMVSAVCPHCHIILAEANDAVDTDVAATVASVAKLGATEISNSYGEPEYPGETQLEPFYDQPGIQVTASAGDSGYGVSYPAASAYVTSVGGTNLFPSSSSRHWQETAWAGTGSGCSTQIGKPAWQHGPCTHRMDNDIAAVASPQTPVAVYDSYGVPGWVRVGGTSASSPIVAGIYALAGDPHSAGGSYFYSHPTHLYDVTSGYNGVCHPSYLCTARPGYDGPTGLGTPDFTGAPATGGTCTGHWTAAPPPAGPPTPEQLLTGFGQQVVPLAIDALSKTNVWTAGYYEETDSSGPGGSNGLQGLIEHWTGSKWAYTRSPSPISSLGYSNTWMNRVSFDSPHDGWAVGLTTYNDTVAARWNGHRWSLSPVLSPIKTYQVAVNGYTAIAWDQPVSVKAFSPGDVWLTGVYFDAYNNTEEGVFLEHWNGRTWSLIHNPPQMAGFTVQGADAISPSDIWLTGVTSGGSGVTTVHWNGRAWSSVKGPNVDVAIKGMSASSPGDIWAVGQAYYASLGKTGPWAMHWNGHAWAQIPVAQPPANHVLANMFTGVVALSPANAWASGGYLGLRAGQQEYSYLLEHWNGHAWSIVRAPSSLLEEGLTGISASGPGNVWSAGLQMTPTYAGDSDFPFVIHNRCGNA